MHQGEAVAVHISRHHQGEAVAVHISRYHQGEAEAVHISRYHQSEAVAVHITLHRGVVNELSRSFHSKLQQTIGTEAHLLTNSLIHK